MMFIKRAIKIVAEMGVEVEFKVKVDSKLGVKHGV